MSREVLIGRGAGWSFVDWMFFCCIRRWPLLVAIDFGRCLEINSVVNPGQLSKCPRAIARRKVDGTGLKAHPCKKDASSACVLVVWMIPLALCVRVLGALGIGLVLGSRGIDQRPFESSLLPRMMSESSLKTAISDLAKRATQLSSHNWPIETREPDLRSWNRWPSLAGLESSLARGISTRLCAEMVWSLATRTVGPFLHFSAYVQWRSAFGSR
jgi:hypothetical protein